MSLKVLAAHATARGQRERNEDFVGMVTPNDPELSTKGVLGAVADGVSGNDGGREASEYAVRGLLADYYATPDTWAVPLSLERVLKAINSWVLQQGSVRPELAGMATTLTCLALRGTFYYFAHVGDTRLYLLRDDKLTRLTTDHVWDRPEMQHVLTRAVGLDRQITLDQGSGPLREGDIFLLLSDGVWASMTQYDIEYQLLELARGTDEPQQCADALIAAALKAGSSDNVSALVMQVESLPEQDLRDSVSTMQWLPVPPRLRIGQVFEGLTVDEMIHASDATVLYRVTDHFGGGRKMVLKTLQPSRAEDSMERLAFAHEEWLARRVVATFFPQVIVRPEQRYLYYLTTWHAGHTLQESIEAGHHFTVPETVAMGIQLVRAVGALHRRSIIHRDIKPGNVHLGDDGQLRLIDLGVAQSGMFDHAAQQAGTPSFLAPEQFDGSGASNQTDLYAVGVTLYHVLTRHYPYGEIEPFQRPHFGEPRAATRYRPDLPLWLENVLHKAVARDPMQRFETADEMLLALERGASRPLPTAKPTPLVQRGATEIWRAIALASLLANLVLVALLIAR
jgi:serine/threonine protein phosphatase PrpC